MSTHFQTIPIAIPIPDRLILFSPHPDDIAISMSALAAWAAPRVPVTIVLMTDGSEAQLPQHVLQPRIHHAATTREKQQARGMMRVEEAMREAAFLGFDRSIVQLLDRQNRFLQHRTPAEYLNPDGTLRDVNGFNPSPVDEHAIAEIRDIIGSGSGTICAVPDPNDRLAVHRITTRLVTENRGNAKLLTYECLSTIDVTPSTNRVRI